MQAVPTRRELFAWLLAFAMALSLVTGLGPGHPERAFGDDAQMPNATETTPEAVPIPEAPPAGTPRTVYIATGLNFPDALGAAAAGGVAMGPVLLVQQNSIPGPTLTELNRLEPNEIVIVGGTAVISDNVKNALAGLAFSPNVTRIAGTNRYDTAAKLSEATFFTRGFHPRVTWAQVGDGGDLAGTNANQVVLSVEHTTELPGIYVISAGADMYSLLGDGDPNAMCWIEVDDVQIEASRRSMEFNGTGGDNTEENCSTQGVFLATTAKTYKIELIVNADTDIYTDERSLIAIWEAHYPGS